MGNGGSRRERRCESRVSMCIPCTVARQGKFGLYWTENLSCRGALLKQGRVFAPGSYAEVTFHSVWNDPIRAAATVVRQSSPVLGQSAAALRLAGAAPDNRLRSVVTPSPRRQHSRPELVVMTHSASLGEHLASDLGSLGADCVIVRRPVDLFWHLDDVLPHATALVVDLETIEREGLDLLWCIAEHFGRVRRALLVEAPIPADAVGWLASRLVHGIIALPWARNDLWRLAYAPHP